MYKEDFRSRYLRIEWPEKCQKIQVWFWKGFSEGRACKDSLMLQPSGKSSWTKIHSVTTGGSKKAGKIQNESTRWQFGTRPKSRFPKCKLFTHITTYLIYFHSEKKKNSNTKCISDDPDEQMRRSFVWKDLCSCYVTCFVAPKWKTQGNVLKVTAENTVSARTVAENSDLFKVSRACLNLTKGAWWERSKRSRCNLMQRLMKGALLNPGDTPDPLHCALSFPPTRWAFELVLTINTVSVCVGKHKSSPFPGRSGS